MVCIITYSDQFQSTFDEVEKHVEKIKHLLFNEKIQPNEKILFFIEYAIRELFNNAVEHGNKFVKQKLVHYSFNYSKDAFSIKVKDEGESISFKSDKNIIQEDILRDRKRGFESLLDLGVKIEIEEDGVQASMTFMNE